jgi:hypothetical protein
VIISPPCFLPAPSSSHTAVSHSCNLEFQGSRRLRRGEEFALHPCDPCSIVSAMSSGVAKLSRISFNSGSNSVRPMPCENAAQSLNSRPSNSCITTKGTKRLVLKADPISLAKSWSKAASTSDAFVALPLNSGLARACSQ